MYSVPNTHPYLSKYPPVSIWLHIGALLSLLGFLILTNSLFIPDIGNYGDETHKWLHAKMLTGKVPISEWIWDHHTARLAIMGVTWLVQVVFGDDPMYYFIPAIIACYGMAISLYAIGCLIYRPAVGFLAALALLTWLPDMFHQLMPSPFVSWFVLSAFAAILFGLKFSKNDRTLSGSLVFWTILAALLQFLAYLSWVGSLFFLPIFALILWLATNWKASMLFLATLAFLYITETLCYWIFGGIPFGRLEIITWYHMTDMDRFKESFQPEFLDLFKRFNYLYGYPKKIIIPFLFILPILLIFWKKLDIGTKLTLSVTLCFLFFLTFSVTSLDPLKPFLMHTQPRYSYPLYPLILLIFSGLIFSILTWIAAKLPYKPKLTSATTTNTILIITLLIVFCFTNIQNRFEGYSWKDRKDFLSSQQEMASIADSMNIPLIQLGKATPKALKYHIDILLDRNNPEGTSRPSPEPIFMQIHARPAWVILPENTNYPENWENPKLEDVYHRDMALFVNQRPYRSSIGSVIQVGISSKASGGRTAHLEHSLWNSPIQWLFDSPKFARHGTPIQGSLNEKNSSQWTYTGKTDLVYYGTQLESWKCKGNTAAQDTLNFELPDPSTENIDLYFFFKTGPSTDGLVLELFDGETNQSKVKLSLIPVFEDDWMLFKLPYIYLQDVTDLKLRLTSSNPSEECWLQLSQAIWADK